MQMQAHTCQLDRRCTIGRALLSVIVSANSSAASARGNPFSVKAMTGLEDGCPCTSA